MKNRLSTYVGHLRQLLFIKLKLLIYKNRPTETWISKFQLSGTVNPYNSLELLYHGRLTIYVIVNAS